MVYNAADGMKNTFDNAQILVTGGLGFVGSNLVVELVNQGAHVTVVDNMVPGQGGNVFNIKPVEKHIAINYSDIRDPLVMNQLVQEKDYIFHLARQTDHILSLTNPFVDIDVNVRGTAVLLEACKKYNPKVKLIYTGTRGQYGKAVRLPVSETAPTHPRGIYEITNLTAEHMIKVYHDVHGIQSVMLRLTNIFGPKSQMKHDHYGVVNWFIRLAMDGKTIPIFGDGMMKRDFLFIDDAIEAILLCSSSKECYGEVINIGDCKPKTFLDLVKTIIQASNSGSFEFTAFTPERAVQNPGDFASDITKIKKLTGWKPTTKLKDGISKTVEYYRKYKKWYW
jgi:UDP-glucose 4-epimerase